MSIELTEDYNNKMIDAFIAKPEKTLWYQMSFSKFNINGVDAMKWNWSWWGFAGGFLFLLYRKQYIASFVVFFISMTAGMIPFMGLIISILVGGYGSYFVYKGYKKKLFEVENQIEDEETRVETMAEVGGYHQWVVWLYVIFVGLIFFGIISAVLIPTLI
jgi:hypothetical protein